MTWVHAPVDVRGDLTRRWSPILQPSAPPASSLPEFVRRTFPDDASKTTQYTVLGDRIVSAGAVKVRVPVPSVSGLVSVATTFVADGRPVAMYTLSPLGALVKFATTLSRV